MHSLPIPAAVIVLSVIACAPTREVDFEPHDDRYQICAARAKQRADASGVTLAATVHDIRDDTAVDGDVRMVLIRGDGRTAKAIFGSSFTSPPPPAERKAVYATIRASRAGDCVVVGGTQTTEGEIWILRFANLDRS